MLVIVRYLLVYKHTAAAASKRKPNSNCLTTFLLDNKLVLFHAAYIIMLALIGNIYINITNQYKDKLAQTN